MESYAKQNKSITYRPEIDGLRAVAVLPVILFHAGFSYFSGGFIGVDVFFVISGYLITSILLNDIYKKKYSIIKFYERRARRILPALIVVSIFCVPAVWLLGNPQNLRDFGQSLVSVATFSSNIYFWLKSDYFSPSAEEFPLLHTWSLSVEEQFYVLFPLLLLLLWTYLRKYLRHSIVLIIIISLICAEVSTRYFASAGFYLLPFRAWELLIGSLIAIHEKEYGLARDRYSKTSEEIIAFSGLLCILASILYFDEHTPFPGIWALLPVLGTALIILFGRTDTLTGRLLSNRPFVGIGLVSYSAYLWHQPLFAFARLESLDKPSNATMLLLAALSLALAYLTWKYVENPFRDAKIVSKKAIFINSFVFLGIFVLAGTYLHFNYHIRAAGTLYEDIVANNADRPNYGIMARKNCPAGSEQPPFCQTGDDAGILLWGDSFAQHLAQFFDKNPSGLVQATKSSCFPSTKLTPFDGSADYNKEWAGTCHRFNKAVMEYARQNEEIEYVVISSTFTWPLKQYDSFDGSKYHRASTQEYIDALEEDISTLRRHGKKVVIFSPTPMSAFDFNKCSSRILLNTDKDITLKSEDTSECHFVDEESEADRFLSAVSSQADVAILDLNEFLCRDGKCSPFVDGQLVYYDWGHLSAFGARTLQEKFDIGGRGLRLAR